jgi:hypothetical protein
MQTKEETLMVVSDSSRMVSLNRFNRLKERKGIDKIDKVVFTNSSVQDIQVFLSRIRNVFSIKEICYYGIKNSLLEDAIEKSFGIKIGAYTDGQKLSKVTECAFNLNGNAFLCNIEDNRVVVFSKFETENAGYSGFSGQFDLMIVYNYHEQISSLYKADRIISYLEKTSYEDAESMGTKSLKLS